MKSTDVTKPVKTNPNRRQYAPEVKNARAAFPKVKLGKLVAKHDARTPYLMEFMDRSKLPPPKPFDWAKGMPQDLGMLGNDKAGNCTCAAILHMLQVQNTVTKKFVPSLDELADAAIDLYKKITLEVNGVAYDPAKPETDTGLALLDVLKYCRRAGLIGAFVKIRHNDVAEIECGGNAFGGLYTGAMLPADAQRQISLGQTWTRTKGPGAAAGSWGGHAMYVPKAMQDLLTYLTWGKRQGADYGWVSEYADEMYVAIDNAWVTGDRPAPSGFDIEKLRSFLSAL